MSLAVGFVWRLGRTKLALVGPACYDESPDVASVWVEASDPNADVLAAVFDAAPEAVEMDRWDVLFEAKAMLTNREVKMLARGLERQQGEDVSSRQSAQPSVARKEKRLGDHRIGQVRSRAEQGRPFAVHVAHSLSSWRRPVVSWTACAAAAPWVSWRRTET